MERTQRKSVNSHLQHHLPGAGRILMWCHLKHLFHGIIEIRVKEPEGNLVQEQIRDQTK